MKAPCKTLALFLALACTAVGGCRSPYPLAKKLRRFQPGDHFTYSINAEGFNPNDVSQGTFQAKLEVEYYSTTYQGRKVLSERREYKDSPLDTFTFLQDLFQGSELYLVQDESTGDVTAVGEFRTSTEIPIDPPQRIYPGVFAPGVTFGLKTRDRFGYDCSAITTIEGTERVKVPLGTFECWKGNTRFFHSRLGEWEQTLWFAPQISAPVRITGTTEAPNDWYLITDAQLVETNVPLGPGK